MRPFSLYITDKVGPLFKQTYSNDALVKVCPNPLYILLSSSIYPSNHDLSNSPCLDISSNLLSLVIVIEGCTTTIGGNTGGALLLGGTWFHKKSYSVEFYFCSSTSDCKCWLNAPNLLRIDTNRKNSDDLKHFS